MSSRPSPLEASPSPFQPSESRLHLLTLPVEIREMILKPCLIQYEILSAPVPYGVSKRRDLSLQVLCVRKQLYEEGGNILYTRNIFDLEEYLSSVPLALENNSRRISKVEVDVGCIFPILKGYLGLSISDSDAPMGSRHVLAALMLNVGDVGETLGLTEDEIDWTYAGFRVGHPKESLDDPAKFPEVAQTISDHIFNFSALKVAHIVGRFHADFTRLYRAARPLKHDWIKRSISVTREPIESMVGRGLPEVLQFQHVAEIEVDVTRVQVKEITGPRAGFCY